MATDRLGVYNNALMLCNQRSLAALTENCESRRLLDQQWNSGAVNFCLQQGQWTFGRRTLRMDYSTTITPDFGYRRPFEKTSDWMTTCALCSDEYFTMPLVRYSDEAGIIYADIDIIYVKFVSNDDAYGGDPANWPESFREYVEAYLASRIIGNLSTDEKKVDRLNNERSGILTMRRRNAKNKDARNEPTSFPPTGSWNRARNGYTRGRGGPLGDGGNSGSLIG